MRSLLVAALFAAAAAPAVAADLDRTSDGYTYFNRPGADMAALDTAVLDCRKRAASMHQPDTMGAVAVPGLAGVLAVMIVKGVSQAMADHTGRVVNIENCMVVKGWRVVALDASEGLTVSALDQGPRAAWLKQWIGATDPRGAVVRTFANDAAGSLASGMFDKAKHAANTALSTEAAIKDSKDQAADDPVAPPATARPGLPSMKKSARPPKPLKPEALGGVPKDSALIVVNVKGAGGMILGFERVGPDASTPAWVDERPASFAVAQPVKAFAKAGSISGTTVAFAIPPGRWRLSSWTSGVFTVSFCMGAPAFDAAAGEVIYAGAFNPNGKGEPIGPDMALEPAKAMFPALSGLADKVRPAAYVNGVVGACSGAYLYALELPGQSFADGYTMGSRAWPAATVATQSDSQSTPAPASAQAPNAASPIR